MKKNAIITFLFLVVFIRPYHSGATHVTGGDITYTCIGPNEYFVTMKLFRDCTGSTMTSTLSITLTNSCGLVNPFLTLTLQDPSGGNCTSGVPADCASEVSQLCATQMANSSCNGGALPGMQEYVYTGTVILPDTCDTWTFDYNLCCRNTTVNVAGQPNYQIVTTMNSATQPCNNSPIFTSQPIPYVCANQPVAYNYGVVETDGDSLAFSLVDALQALGSPVPYNGGYTGASPIPGIAINPVTGQITFTPTLVGNFVVTIMVQEFRNGELIGTVMRDQQFVVQACSNTVPTATAGTITNFSGNALQSGPYSIQMCEGDNFSFTTTFTDPNAGDILTLLTNITTVLPGATFTTSGTSPITATVTWTAPIGSAGTNNSFYITVDDGACPVPGMQTMIYYIDVQERTSAGPDEYYCPGGVTIQLSAQGGTSFTWSPATGLSCTNCPNPIATPSVTTTYIVTSNLSNNCINKDTITVFNVPDFIPFINPASTTICKYGSTVLSAGGDASGSPYNVTWTPSTGISCPTCATTTASPLVSTPYMATIVASSGCTVEMNTMVNVVGVAPNIDATTVDSTMCAGSGTLITTMIYPDMCTTTTLACTGPSNTGTIGTGAFSTSTYSPYYLFANPTVYGNRKQYLFTAAELNAMGFTGGGKISSIALNFTTAGSNTQGMVIKMGCTSLPMFPNGNFVNGLSVVKTAFTSNPTIGWNTYTLTNPYLWDGISNLIVEFCIDNPESGTTANISYDTYGTNYYMIYYNTTVAGACSYPVGTRTTARPSMQFTYCQANPPVTYSWTPTTGLSSTNTASTTATPATTTTYTVSATSGGCVGTDLITISVVPNFNVTIAPANSTICLNNDVQLNATPSIAGTYTYSWTPTAGLSCTTCANPIASPSATTVYTCTVTSSGGCTKTATATVTISGAAPNVTATVLDNTVCQGSSTLLGSIIYPDFCTTTALACSGAANTGTVGTGTFSTTTYSPFYLFAAPTTYSNRRQYIVTAAELNAMGFTGGGKITSIALNYTTAGSSTTGVVISMGCTSLPMFPDGNFITGLSVVRPAFTTTPAIGWNTYTLTNPYLWDGVSNLVVEFCLDNLQSGTAASVMYNTYGTNYYMNYYIGSANGACSVVTGTRVAARPNMQFTLCPAVPAYTYSWTPTTGVSNPSSSSSTVTPTGTTTYTLSVTNGGCAGVTSVAVNVVPTFNVTMSPASATICLNNDVQLNAIPSIAGSYTYSWSPAAGLSCTTCANPIASPSSTTVYTCTVSSAAGCDKTASVTVTVSGSAPNVTATVLDNTVCAGGTTQLGTIIYPDFCTTTALACSGPASIATVGAGTSSTSTYGPSYTSVTAYGNRKQYLYTAAELTAAGFTGGGKITAIALNYTSVGTPLNNMVIKMGCTTLTQFPDGTFVPGLTTVKTTFTHTPAMGWNTFTLTSPYLWDGISNLVVEYCVDAAQTGTASNVMYSLTGANYYHIYYNSTTATGNCAVTLGTRTTARPDMRFSFCSAVPAYTYSWTPTTGVASPSSSTTNVTPTGNTTYTVSVTNGGCAGTSSVALTVVPTFTLAMSPNTTICQNNSYQLSATPSIAGSYTYSWSPTTGLSSANIANPVATPSSSTVYTVTVTSAAGCSITGTVNVTVSGLAPNLAIDGDNLVCPLQSNTLTALVYPASCTTTALACIGAAETITVGTGTFSTSTYSPYYTTATAYGNRKVYLYTAAELSAMGFAGGGKITSIALKYATAGTALTNMVIKMGCTSLAQFPDGNFIPGLTTVKTAFSQVPNLGWNTYTLTNPYLWDGVSNLLVEFCVDAAQTGTAANVEYATTSIYNQIYYNSTSLTGNCSVVLGTRVMARPNMQFTFCPAVPSGTYTYAWSPPTGLSSTNTLSTTSSIASPTTYTLTVTSGSCSSTASFPIAIDNTNSVTITPNPDTSLCPANTVQLEANFTGPVQPSTLPSCGVNATACSQTQYYATVGTGAASSTSYSPFYQSFNDNKVQYLIRASDLNAAGITSGTIRELAWNVITKSSTLAYTGFTISLGCTNETVLSTATGWLPVTTVWTGNYTSAVGWNNFVLTSPYDWNGTSNIVVQVCYNNGNAGSSFADATQYTIAPYTCNMYYYSSANGDQGCTLAATYTTTGRPNMRFRVCPPPPPSLAYSWTGPVSNSTIANPTTFPLVTTTYSVVVTGGICTVYDTATIYICQVPLSIELMSFTGRQNGDVNELYWVTQSEINNDYFTLERSPDGNTFIPIGIIDGGGNTNDVRYYDFTDQQPHSNYNYYRLKQTDFNGDEFYSTVLLLRDADELSFMVSPNPAHETLVIEIETNEDAVTKIELYDLAGRLLMVENLKTVKGNNLSIMNISQLSNGTYMLKVSSVDTAFERVIKIVKD